MSAVDLQHLESQRHSDTLSAHGPLYDEGAEEPEQSPSLESQTEAHTSHGDSTPPFGSSARESSPFVVKRTIEALQADAPKASGVPNRRLDFTSGAAEALDVDAGELAEAAEAAIPPCRHLSLNFTSNLDELCDAAAEKAATRSATRLQSAARGRLTRKGFLETAVEQYQREWIAYYVARGEYKNARELGWEGQESENKYCCVIS